MSFKSRIILALDSNNFSKIQNILSKISNEIYGVKVGYQFFFNFGTTGYKYLQNRKLKIFFDFKLHDIPNTVFMGIKALNKLNPSMLTVHISGGNKMLSLARKNRKKSKIIGVSALTSLDEKNISLIYNRSSAKKLVKDMVKIALKSKLDGIVCSPKEIKLVKDISKDKLIIITPGIRVGKKLVKNDDQKRILTPKEAIKLGADFLVIGRPILNSKNPKKLVKFINDQTI